MCARHSSTSTSCSPKPSTQWSMLVPHRHSEDTTPIQRKVTHDYIMRIREAMRRVMYEAIVMKARDEHLAGATVLRGPMGFGAASRIHTAKILRLSMNLPIVIEIVDS